MKQLKYSIKPSNDKVKIDDDDDDGNTLNEIKNCYSQILNKEFELQYDEYISILTKIQDKISVCQNMFFICSLI